MNPSIYDLQPGIILSPRSKLYQEKAKRESEKNVPPQSTSSNPVSNSSTNETRPFILKEKLAEGSYGAVYKAAYCDSIKMNEFNQIDHGQIKESGELLAVKIMTNPAGITSIDGSSIGPPIEMDIMSRLRHPNLLAMSQITIVDFATPIATKHGTHPRTTLAILMPLAISNLTDYMLSNKISLETKIMYIQQILSGLNYLHTEQILHLDIKMENILVLSTNHVVLTDFGLSVYTDPDGNRNYERESITVTCRPPELFKNHNYYQRSSDVWSLGMFSLFLLLGVKHIFPNIRPSAIKSKLLRTFKDSDRKRNLDLSLQVNIPNSHQRNLIVDFLDKCLAYNPSNRQTTGNLLNHPMFGLFSTPLAIDQNSLPTSLYPLTWIYPPEQIGLEPYLAVDFIVRLMISVNPLVETFFIAIDIFQRSLSYLYVLYQHFKSIGSEESSLTEIISLGGLISVWVAFKANESRTWTVRQISNLASGHYSQERILEIERHMVVGLKGIIYRWNPFKEAANPYELSSMFETVTNLYTYPHRIPNRNGLPANPPEKMYQTNFNSIYCRTKFYQESRSMKTDEHPKYRFKRDRDNYFRHRTGLGQSEPRIVIDPIVKSDPVQTE